MSSITKYVIVPNDDESSVSGYNSAGIEVAELLDAGFTLVISWVVGNCVHHILNKDLDVQ